MKHLRQNLFIAFCLGLLIIKTSMAKSETHSTTPSNGSSTSPELVLHAAIRIPRATTCLAVISGCGYIRIGNQSILIHPIETSREVDGSTTVSGMAHWINRNDVSESVSDFAIILPKQMFTTGHIADHQSTRTLPKQSPTSQSTQRCSANINNLDMQHQVLAQGAEVMMGQESVSRRAAIFTPTCID